MIWVSIMAPMVAFGEEKKSYFFAGAKFTPIIALSKDYNLTHDLDLGGAIHAGYQWKWIQIYSDILFTGGFGGDIGGEKYSTKGIWVDFNLCANPLGDINKLAVYIGTGGGIAYFSSDLTGFESETSGSVNGIVGAFQKLGIGRIGVDLQIKYAGITFPPGAQNLLLSMIQFYWDFTF